MGNVRRLTLSLFFIYLFYYVFQAYYNLPRHSYYIGRQKASNENLERVINLDEKFDYLILGDSTCLHSIQPKDLPFKSYNLCFSGASNLDVYNILRKLRFENINKGIILSLSFYTSSHYDSHLWERFISTGFYSNYELLLIWIESLENNVFPSNKMSFIEYFFKIIKSRALLFSGAIASLRDFFLAVDLDKNHYEIYSRQALDYDGFMPHPNNYYFSNEEFYASYTSLYSKKFHPDHTDEYYFFKILDLLKLKYKKIIFLGPTLASSVTKKSTKIFEDSFKEYFKQIESKYHCFKYTDIPYPTKRVEIFDFNHISWQGAKNLSLPIGLKLKKADNLLLGCENFR